VNEFVIYGLKKERNMSRKSVQETQCHGNSFEMSIANPR
jgi:hypothetical protein